MYQSFPQRRICASNSAMPVLKHQNNKNFCEDKKECIEKNDNYHSDKCKDEKQVFCEEKNTCEEESLCVKESLNNPLSSLFGDLFKNFEIDDLILIGLILFLLYEGEDDIIIIGILALILFL